MSSGNITTEETRREGAEMEQLLRESALVSNHLLRRALAELTHDYIVLMAERRPELLADPDAGVAVMLVAVMTASEKLERESAL